MSEVQVDERQRLLERAATLAAANVVGAVLHWAMKASEAYHDPEWMDAQSAGATLAVVYSERDRTLTLALQTADGKTRTLTAVSADAKAEGFGTPLDRIMRPALEAALATGGATH